MWGTEWAAWSTRERSCATLVVVVIPDEVDGIRSLFRLTGRLDKGSLVDPFLILSWKPSLNMPNMEP